MYYYLWVWRDENVSSPPKAESEEVCCQDHEKVQVYCKCRMPELSGEQLMECTNCTEWYHLDTCIDVPCTNYLS